MTRAGGGKSTLRVEVVKKHWFAWDWRENRGAKRGRKKKLVCGNQNHAASGLNERIKRGRRAPLVCKALYNILRRDQNKTKRRNGGIVKNIRGVDSLVWLRKKKKRYRASMERLADVLVDRHGAAMPGAEEFAEAKKNEIRGEKTKRRMKREKEFWGGAKTGGSKTIKRNALQKQRQGVKKGKKRIKTQSRKPKGRVRGRSKEKLRSYYRRETILLGQSAFSQLNEFGAGEKGKEKKTGTKKGGSEPRKTLRWRRSKPGLTGERQGGGEKR